MLDKKIEFDLTMTDDAHSVIKYIVEKSGYTTKYTLNTVSPRVKCTAILNEQVHTVDGLMKLLHKISDRTGIDGFNPLLQYQTQYLPIGSYDFWFKSKPFMEEYELHVYGNYLKNGDEDVKFILAKCVDKRKLDKITLNSFYGKMGQGGYTI